MKLDISLTVAFLILALWMLRWKVVDAVPRGDAFGFAYKLNRFGAEVHLLHGVSMEDVKLEKASP